MKEAEMDTLTRPPDTAVYRAELAPTLEAPRAARSFVADVLTAWAIPADLVDTARLLTSELATNAITHGQDGEGQGTGGTVTLEVRSFGCCLSVDVADYSRDVPVVRLVEDGTPNGRGLLLVAGCADSWGYYFEGLRKHVWFHLRISPTPSPTGAAVVPAA